jgi:hypothetical protein
MARETADGRTSTGSLKKARGTAAKAIARATLERVLDDVTSPDHMTKKTYRDFLAELIADLQIRLEAVVEELNDDG